MRAFQICFPIESRRRAPCCDEDTAALSNFGGVKFWSCQVSEIQIKFPNRKSKPPQKTISLEYKFCSEIWSGEGFDLGPNCRQFWTSKLASKLISKIQSRRACQILTGLKCLTVIFLGIIKWDTLYPIRETPAAPANLILF